MSKTWGTPTWYFFHSFAEHIDENFYKANSTLICELFRLICLNLPCEECTKHATQYTANTLHGKFIPTKDLLKEYFFRFHNSVNVRTKKDLFTDYDMYKLSKLGPITSNFIKTYGGSRNPHRGFSDQLNRNIVVNKIIDFMNNNNNYFIWL